MLEELDYAWAAGFLDGEGAIMIHRNTRSGQISLCIRVTQTTMPALDKLILLFGGTVTTSSRNVHQWNLYGMNAVRMLQKIRPYLIEKAGHCEVALRFMVECYNTTNVEKKMEYYEQMRLLQKKGQHLRKDKVS
jgi:hypothetical protein